MKTTLPLQTERSKIRMKIDYEALRENLFEEYEKQGKKFKLLLHSCCAPCSTACLARLVEKCELAVYYYNPNIDGLAEFSHRASEQKRLLSEAYGDKIPLFVENYNADEFYAACQGLEKEPEGGARCEKCFKLRLEKTAEFALKNGYDGICTTLTVSPHKNAPLINEIGELAAKKFGVKWAPCDFKKQNGFLISTKLSEKFRIYRQNYCGCAFSKAEALSREKTKNND